MGGIFGVAKKTDCVSDLFYGVDYHSHLGTRRGGMAVYNKEGFSKSIHNIENTPFRTKFEQDVLEMHGTMGIGCISDNEPQPLIVRAHFGNYVLTTVGRINNLEEIANQSLQRDRMQFMELSMGRINATEVVASIISSEDSIVAGIQKAQELIDGSLSLLVMTEKGIYAVRDLMGRTPLIIGKNDHGYAASFESFAYHNLDYRDYYELGPGEVVFMTSDGLDYVLPRQQSMRVCSFMWIYYGYPTSSYEGINVEEMRYRCGANLAKRDGRLDLDYVAGVPDSGIAHALGYSHQSHLPYSRPLIKYTPTWPRSFTPSKRSMRMTIAGMKLVSVGSLIKDKKLLLIDDSIVRGTQTYKMAKSLFEEGAKEVHLRSACPPIVFPCKYLNFFRSNIASELITRRTIQELEGEKGEEKLDLYTDSRTEEYRAMVERIAEISSFTSLKYNTVEDIVDAIGLNPCQLCTYCMNGKE